MEEQAVNPADNTVLKCLVTDDEPIARDGIISYIDKLDFLEVAGVCSSAIEAAEHTKNNVIDLMFLDIQMPNLSGLEFLESMDTPPLTILTTAHSEYALEGFRLQVVDYLLKPITFKRFFQASLRAREIFNLRNNGEDPGSPMYVRQGDSFMKIAWLDILYVESMQNYLKLHFRDKVLVIHQTMTFLENILPKDSFFRIHKSYLVHLSHIDLIKGNRVYINHKALPVSRQRKDEFLNTVVYKNLMSK
ncbi:LytR/AlgR family response regulator transcription factor [Sinomicrobium weinanense]|uniref:Response regulator transcription factor n=1 Tax=Sinomicrobium weinanense TaxID=2842200 RepID=A0A926JV85_9FLAO|nr:LytTR family DNA-binding domain-containing protein [Sinomicrobium weinanense]MBC9797823.1 response regulator transcription factor [Sinomicrobium weinanense]MBU3124658.1 LytTR family DNA-binding domain-containing protein [Sinomicrobium weinanense]